MKLTLEWDDEGRWLSLVTDTGDEILNEQGVHSCPEDQTFDREWGSVTSLLEKLGCEITYGINPESSYLESEEEVLAAFKERHYDLTTNRRDCGHGETEYEVELKSEHPAVKKAWSASYLRWKRVLTAEKARKLWLQIEVNGKRERIPLDAVSSMRIKPRTFSYY